MLGDEYLSFWAKNAGNTGVRHKQTLELRNIEYEQICSEILKLGLILKYL